MIAELAIILLLVSAGVGMLSPLRAIPVSARIWLAAPTGSAVYMLVSLLLVLLTGTLHPGAILGIAVLLGLTGMVVAITKESWDRRSLVWAAIGLAVTAVIVLLVRTVHLTRLTPDSLQYLAVSTNLRLPDAVGQVLPYFLLKRQFGLPALHSLTEFTDRRYLPSIGPLFGVSCLGMFVWMAWRATRKVLPGRVPLVLTAALLLVTSNQLVYHFFYINTHIAVATYLLIAIGGAWLAVTEDRLSWAIPAGLALSATLVLRPEAPVVVAIALVALAATNASRPIRLAMTTPSVIVIALWYGAVLLHNVRPGDKGAVIGNMVTVLGAALLALPDDTSKLRRLIKQCGWLMLATLLSAFIFLWLRDPTIVSRSVVATFRNLTSDGMWMLTWPVVLVLGIVALFVQRIPGGRFWTTSIVGFGVLWWLLPLLRGGPWRVGTGDSGNRILAHFLPVVMLFLVLAAVDKWPFARESLDSPKENGATQTDPLSKVSAPP